MPTTALARTGTHAASHPRSEPAGGPAGPMSARTTHELVGAARGRDPKAWEELVSRYQGMVRGVVASFRLQESDAADAVQNTWLRALERLDGIRDPERLGGWLATTARRECLAVLRRSRREVPDEVRTVELATAAPEPEAVVLAREARRALDRAVAELPGRRRELVHALFYRPELRYTEVSRAMGVPVGSIGPTRRRVLGALRCGLVRAGVDTPSPVA
jgi:RNA polymerase sigma factor (sigma-70 family)